ncbi:MULTISPECIES: TetR/AcrR family transcriptional regulator [Pandoraea]|jgi:AcrR family transcriptional regulator|uniref:Bacterial regulatory proteins, tetR family n=1 Tax=Pandoraea pnomenusa TaxID=93220 RepID=A0A378YIZ0_9BURK|nr:MULTISPECIES: TetR/AcrR family transcriptional regulator [Pandoraea]AHB05102.1 TetR family transcriptional regulator [Pandoraea pnomenusa 3kgm]AHB74524.1 TetR family transcriptional regulator [Pandoraea pnomenusa]AHN77132.1 TetR family transcriptional regulator [Pandoraea pnomenusa]AIU26331.1 TetR family transcriptional regulator [Pandoraea pnomenusa]ANC43574.1 TetR family transcriptional regulator [Pandoraea pnomenusa]
MTEQETVTGPARTTYRHGDLRRALLDAGIALARDGGPDAVILREATRRAGVVPNAAYRHFANRQALLDAVRAASLAALAVGIEREIAALDAPLQDTVAHARAVLRAVGIGYLHFARAQPGLFRTAFAPSENVRSAGGPEKAGASGLNPFELLGAALDGMVAAGIIDAGQRPGAEYLAWAAVHGLAVLVIDGPLRDLPDDQVDGLGQRLVAMVEKGL